MFAPTACAPHAPLCSSSSSPSPRRCVPASGAAAQSVVSTPSARTLYATGPSGRFLLDGTWLFRRDPAGAGLRSGWQRRTGTAGWSPVTRPERLERDGSVGGLVRRRRRLVPPRLPPAERPPRARLGRALRVGELPRADLAQRPPDRRAHRRLPALRGHAAGVGAASRRDEPPGHPRRQPPAGDGLPARGPVAARDADRRLVELRRAPARGLPPSRRRGRPRRGVGPPARPLRGLHGAAGLPRAGRATSAGMPAASRSAAASAAAASRWAAPRSRPAARRPCGGRCACPARGCGRRRRRTSTTPR